MKTREEWLTRAVRKLAPLFAEIKEEIPEVRVSVGWPGGGSPRKRIGECWKPECAADGVAQVFISPMLSEPEQVLSTLTHELIHAVDRCESGHKGNFARMARAIGLEGKMTATHAGLDLLDAFTPIKESLGEYPHAALTLLEREKKQGTRMIKVVCKECGYTLRTTKLWIEQGLPTCACSSEMEVA